MLLTGNGEISSVLVSIKSSSSFSTGSPSFTLVGETRGGPPESYTWRRNGTTLANGGSYSISISVKESSSVRFRESVYISTMTVTGRLPGIYEYSVNNRAMSSVMTNNIDVEGWTIGPLIFSIITTISFTQVQQPLLI